MVVALHETVIPAANPTSDPGARDNDAVVALGVQPVGAVSAAVLLNLDPNFRSISAHSKIGGIRGRPANATVAPLLPHANVLILVSQVQAVAIVEVVGLHGVGGAAVKVLSASHRRQQLRIAGDLGHLDGELSVGSVGSSSELKV